MTEAWDKACASGQNCAYASHRTGENTENRGAGQSLRDRTKKAMRGTEERERKDGGAGQSLRIRREAATCVAQNRGGKEGERGAGGRLMTGESGVATEVRIHAP